MNKIITHISLGGLFLSGVFIAHAQSSSASNANEGQCIAVTRNMSIGATDAITDGQVTKLQKFLQEKGFFSPGLSYGTFGPRTKDAVMAFQRSNGIRMTGTVGPLTRSAIASACESSSNASQNPASSAYVNPSMVSNPLATSTVNSSGKGPVVTLSVNDVVVQSGETLTFPRERAYGSSGVKLPTSSAYVTYKVTGSDSDRCYRTETIQGVEGPEQAYYIFNGSDSFSVAVLPNHTYSYKIRCTGSGGQSIAVLTFVGKPQESNLPKPVITLKVNDVVVQSGDTVTFPRQERYASSSAMITTSVARVRYDVQNVNSDRCYRTSYPFPGVEQEYFIFNGSDSFSVAVPPNETYSYKIRCVGAGGETIATLTLVGKPQESNLPKPVITMKVNGSVVKSGETITLPREMEYGSSGVKIMSNTAYVRIEATNISSDRCYRTTYPFPGVEQEFFMPDSFAVGTPTGEPQSYKIRCVGAGGEATSTLTFVSKPQESNLPKPVITLKVNDVVVKSGDVITFPRQERYASSSVMMTTNIARMRYDVTNATKCYRTSFPFPGVEQEYFMPDVFSVLVQPNETYSYKIRCVGAGGESTAEIIVTGNSTTSSFSPTQSSAVLGVSTSCVNLPYNFHRGHESGNVTKLQSFLSMAGFLDEVTGFYGDKTVAAVKAYQESRGLPATGMVYDFTRGAIRADTCQ